MEIASKYNPAEVEEKCQYWMEHNLFHSEPDEREPYTIVIPPQRHRRTAHGAHAQQHHPGCTGAPCARKEKCSLGARYRPCFHRHRGKVVNRLAVRGLKERPHPRCISQSCLEWTHEHGESSWSS